MMGWNYTTFDNSGAGGLGRRIGEFLKELDLTEGYCTEISQKGVPSIPLSFLLPCAAFILRPNRNSCRECMHGRAYCR